jgi:hypothetical protein
METDQVVGAALLLTLTIGISVDATIRAIDSTPPEGVQPTSYSQPGGSQTFPTLEECKIEKNPVLAECKDNSTFAPNK